MSTYTGFGPSVCANEASRTSFRLLWAIALAVLALVSLGGCATVSDEAPAPLTVPQIVNMSREGVPPHTIISHIRKSQTVYRLKASQLAELHDQGVPDSVIDYMQRTYLKAARRRAEVNNWDNWTEDDGWWYGGSPWGWPDDWSPYDDDD